MKFIPPEYEQYLVAEDSTIDWKNIPELQELADKIIQWKNLQLPKNSKEYNLLCYRTAQMLMKHEARKGGFYYENHIDRSNSGSILVNEEKQIIEPKEKQYLLTEVFEKYCEENQTSWSEDTRKEYEGNFQNIFSLLEIATEKKISDMHIDDITMDSINRFFSDLKHLPYNFTKRFNGKMLLSEAIDISKMAKKEIVLILTKKHLIILCRKINRQH